MSLLATSLVFFAAAAFGGVALARYHVRRKRPPMGLSAGHPILAASGVLLLGAAYVRAERPSLLLTGLVLVTVAMGLGMVLAFLRVKRGGAPVILIGLHALVAVSAASFLVYELVAGRESVPPPFGN